jgi:hypothetical protein
LDLDGTLVEYRRIYEPVYLQGLLEANRKMSGITSMSHRKEYHIHPFT